MNILEVENYIKEVAENQKLVKQVNIGDIYQYLNKADNVKYANINIDITSAARYDGYLQYTIYLYYTDRLTTNEDNYNFIKADAQNALQSILNDLNDEGEIITPYTITFFKQKFIDNCAGGWVTFNYIVSSELGVCNMDEDS